MRGGTELPLPNGGWINGVIPQYIKKSSTACGGENGKIKKATRNGMEM